MAAWGEKLSEGALAVSVLEASKHNLSSRHRRHGRVGPALGAGVSVVLCCDITTLLQETRMAFDDRRRSWKKVDCTLKKSAVLLQWPDTMVLMISRAWKSSKLN